MIPVVVVSVVPKLLTMQYHITIGISVGGHELGRLGLHHYLPVGASSVVVHI